MSERRPITDIAVAERFRKEVGDVSSLRASIDSVGLLHPIVIQADGTLIAGARRLEAVRQLGWDEIDVTVAESLTAARDLLVAERDENTERLDMKPSERVALGRALEALVATPRGRPSEKPENFPGFADREKGDTRDKVGAAVGMSGPTYQRAKHVVAEAETGNPVAIEAQQEMDETGKVTPAYEKVTGHSTRKPKPINLDSARNKQVAEAAKRRVEGVVGTCNALATGLDDLKVELALLVASPKEVASWNTSFRQASAAISRLRKRLKE